jgi:RES domain-containing protein
MVIQMWRRGETIRVDDIGQPVAVRNNKRERDRKQGRLYRAHVPKSTIRNWQVNGSWRARGAWNILLPE